MGVIPGGFACTSEDMHPYECGPGCRHCSKIAYQGHEPSKCWLCCDGDPNLPEKESK